MSIDANFALAFVMVGPVVGSCFILLVPCFRRKTSEKGGKK